MKKYIQTTVVAALAIQAMAASCGTITDPIELTLDVKAVSGTYNVPQGTVTFGAPQNCSTVNPEQYLTTALDITNARVTGITLRTEGSFGGSVSGGSVAVNGTDALTFAGTWNDYATPQATGSSSLLNVNPAGVSALIAAVKNRAPVTICTHGGFSEPAPQGLRVIVDFQTQVDVTP